MSFACALTHATRARASGRHFLVQVFVPATLFRVLWGCSGVDELRPNDAETMHFSRIWSATSSRWQNLSSSSSSEVSTRKWSTCGVERRNGNGKSQSATLILYQTRRFGAWKKVEEKTTMNIIYNKHKMYLTSKNQRPSFFGTP